MAGLPLSHFWPKMGEGLRGEQCNRATFDFGAIALPWRGCGSIVPVPVHPGNEKELQGQSEPCNHCNAGSFSDRRAIRRRHIDIGRENSDQEQDQAPNGKFPETGNEEH